ncbi:MAG: ATP-binding protein [Verrucomicrobiota bacterium]|jgi:nitrogen-specific signal transduction histidine kinase/CheY-like chemotaxis protein
MKTILVLSPHPDFAETIRASLNPEQYRVVHRLSVDEAEPLLVHGLADACILDVDLMGVEGVWVIERLRRRDAKSPLIAYTANTQSEWEEEAFLRGVTHVLAKPVRSRLLNSLLERLWHAPATQRPAQTLPPPAPMPSRSPSFQTPEPSPNRVISASQTLDVLSDFSSILTHSLDAEAMLKQFLLFLREILSVNRAAIFLHRPLPLTETSLPEDSRRLRAVAAIGLSPGLLEHLGLSLDSGIGGQLSRLGRILRRDSDEARADVETQKEFELLGAQVAVPIPARDAIAGVAVFDVRITGEPLVNIELELIFHLLEQVGLALCNIELHDRLAGNNEMMTDVLRELSSACIVVGRDLNVLHANKAARRHFGQKNKRTGELEFSDLPQVLGAKIYQVLKTGAAMGPYRYEPENSPGTVYSVSVVPFQHGNSTVPVSALLTADDLTQTEQLRRLEVEAANLRLIKSMADRLAHEIGNALVPLATHQQLLAEKYKDKEFRESLDQALADGVKRVTRLINQMRFLAREGHIEQETFTVGKLIEEAYQEARKHQSADAGKLQFETVGKPVVITGDRAALKHALAEIMLNALQANPKEPKIGVTLHTEANRGGVPDVQIEVQDNGSGFTAEAARKAPAPFFTTRNVGLGLGLTVSRKIIETHHGKLEIVPPQAGQPGVVRVSLPVESGISTAVAPD